MVFRKHKPSTIYMPYTRFHLFGKWWITLEEELGD